MSDDIKVGIDTTEAAKSLMELELLVKRLDKSFDGISAEKLIAEYRRLRAAQSELIAEYETLRKASASGIASPEYVKRVSTLLTGIGQMRSQIGGLNKILDQHRSSLDNVAGSAKKVSASWGLTVQGVKLSARAMSDLSPTDLKKAVDLAEAAKTAARDATGAQRTLRSVLSDAGVRYKADMQSRQYLMDQEKASVERNMAAWAAYQSARQKATGSSPQEIASQKKTAFSQRETSLVQVEQQSRRNLEAEHLARLRAAESERAEVTARARKEIESFNAVLDRTDRAVKSYGAGVSAVDKQMSGGFTKSQEHLTKALAASRNELEAQSRAWANMGVKAQLVQGAKDWKGGVSLRDVTRAHEDALKADAVFNAKRADAQRRAEEELARQNQAALRNTQAYNAAIQRLDEAKAQVHYAALRNTQRANEVERREQQAHGQSIVAIERRTAAERERTIRDAERRLAADAAYARKSAIDKAKQAEQASLSLSAGRPLGEVRNQYGLLATNTAQSRGTAALAAEINRLSQAQQKVGQTSQEAAKHMGHYTDAQWEAHSAARGLTGSLGALWLTYGALVPLLAGAAIGGAVREVVTSGKDLEFQFKMIEAVSDGATVSMDRFHDAIKGAMFSPQEAAEGLRMLAQAGLSVDDSLTALPSVLKLATVGETDMSNAALTATSVMNTFGLAITDIRHIGDVFGAAAAASSTSVTQLMESMKQASSASNLYNASLEETAAVLAAMAQRGITGSAAGTAFRNMLKEMAAPSTDRAAFAMKQFGLEMFDANGNLKPLMANLEQLSAVYNRMSGESRVKWLNDLFNERGAKAAGIILSDMSKLKEYLEEIDMKSKGLGFLTEAEMTLATSVEGQYRNLKKNISLTFDEIFQEVQPSIQRVVASMNEFVTSGGFKQAVMAIADAVSALTRILIDHGDAIALMIKAYAGYKVISIFAGMMVSGATAVVGMTTTLVEATAAIRTMQIGLTAAPAALAAASGGMMTMGLAARGLGAALLGLALNPVVLALTALVGLAGYAAYKLYTMKSVTQEVAEASAGYKKELEVLNRSSAEGVKALQDENKALAAQIGLMLEGVDAAKAFARSKLDVKVGEINQKIQEHLSAAAAANNSASSMKPRGRNIEDMETKRLLNERRDAELDAARQLMDEKTKLVNSANAAMAESELNGALKKNQKLIEEARSLNTQLAAIQQKAGKTIGVEPINPAATLQASGTKGLEDRVAKLRKELAPFEDKYVPKERAQKTDLRGVFEVRDVRKEAEAEYRANMDVIGYYKDFYQRRLDAQIINRDDYNKALDAIAEREIELGIEREHKVQDAIGEELAKGQGPEAAQRLESLKKESIARQAELETKAKVDRINRQDRADIDEYDRHQKRLDEMNKLEAKYLSERQDMMESYYGFRLRSQQEFDAKWLADEGDGYKKAVQDGNRDLALKIAASYQPKLNRYNMKADPENGYTDAMVRSDKAKAAPAGYDDLETQLSDMKLKYEGYYNYLLALRLKDEVSYEQMQTKATEIATRTQQELTAIAVAGAQQRLEYGTGGWDDMVLTSLARVTEGFTTFAAGTSQVMGDFFTSFTDGFANSVGRAIVYGDDLNESLANVAREGLASLISGLVKLGIQWMINAMLGQTIQTTMQATTLATNSATASAVAASWAPAAALASLATLGSNAVGAATALLSTTALSESIAFAGAFDEGGKIPAGKWGIAGEYGPEIIQGPAHVTSRRETANLLREPASAGGRDAAPVNVAPPNVNIKNINVLDPAIVGDYLNTDEGERVIMNVFQRNRQAVGA